MTQLIKQAKRSELTLILEILQNTLKPVKKTNLLYMARINFHQLDNYLNLMLAKGLVKNIVKPFTGYQITEKGIQFIGLLE